MKVWISSYRDHWIPPITILQRICIWRVVPLDDDDESPYDDPVIDRWTDALSPWCEKLREFLDWIHPPVRYVKVDPQDTWSMDHTLAHIIHPMLLQLKATKHGSPHTDLEDIPAELHPKVVPGPHNNWDDETVHERWEWVLNEMIWAFEQELKDDDTSQFYDHSGVDTTASLQTQVGQMKVDRVGLDAHNKRKENGFRLFGRYYQSLWD